MCITIVDLIYTFCHSLGWMLYDGFDDIEVYGDFKVTLENGTTCHVMLGHSPWKGILTFTKLSILNIFFLKSPSKSCYMML